MDEKKYIELLVAAGKDKKEATEFIKKVIAVIKEKMPTAAPETQEAVLMLKLDDILHGTGGESFTGLCVGCDKLEDSFRFDKQKCEEAFKQDSNQAIMKGLAKMGDDGKPIWLDARQWLDKKETKKNNNFGKPLPTRMQRQMVFIVDGKIVRVFGNASPEIGKAYDFKANVSDSGYFSMSKDSMKECAEQPSPEVIWDATYRSAGESDAVIALCDIKNAPKNTFVVTKGYVKHTTDTSNGGAMIVLKDGDCDEGVVGFSASDEACAVIIHEIVKGQEVISIGRVAVMKDGRYNLVTMGVIPNPASSDVSSGLDALDDLSI